MGIFRRILILANKISVGFSHERVALFLVLLAMALLSFYRAYQYWTTGFFVADEFGYASDAMHGIVYGGRWFFGLLNILLFQGLRIDTVDKFAMLLPFYTFFWSGLTIFLQYKIMKVLEFGRQTIILSLFSSLFLVTFVLLSLGFLTEPVGLGMAMLGVFFLVKFFKHRGRPSFLLLYPFLASLSFSAARYSREPYAIFLIIGAIPVAIMALDRLRGIRPVREPKKLLILLFAIVLFLVPSIFFLEYPRSILSQVPDLPNTISQVVQSTSSSMANNSNAMVPTQIAQVGTAQIVNNFARVYRVDTALWIFFGGLVLGWGPVLFGVGLVGIYALLRKALTKNSSLQRSVLVLSVSALGSYFFVSLISSVDPNFFSPANYSAVIRFSETSVPAYFLLAPFAFSTLSKKRLHAVLLALVLVSTLSAIPAYQVYASSNVTYAVRNPFSLDYRTPAVQIRDYIYAHQGSATYYILGVPYGWVFTPGVEDLSSIQVYDLSPNPLIQSISYSSFLMNKWTVFYIYSPSDLSNLKNSAPYLLSLVDGTNGASATSSQPYTLISHAPVLNGSDFVFVRVQLSWS